MGEGVPLAAVEKASPLPWGEGQGEGRDLRYVSIAGQPEHPGYMADRMPARKLLALDFSRSLSFDSDCAEASTCSDAEPVSLALAVTAVIQLAISLTRSAAVCIFAAISLVATPCFVTASAIADAIPETSPMVAPILRTSETDSPDDATHLADLGTYAFRRLRRFNGQCLHFLGDSFEALAGLARSRRLDGRV